MGDESIPPPPLLLLEINDGSGEGCCDEEDPSSESYLALPREWHQHPDDAPTIVEDDTRLIILRYPCDAVMCRPAAQGILLIILSTRPRDDEPMRRQPMGRQANATTSPCDNATTSPCDESLHDHEMTSPRDYEPTQRRAHSTRCQACFIPQRRQRPGDRPHRLHRRRDESPCDDCSLDDNAVLPPR